MLYAEFLKRRRDRNTEIKPNRSFTHKQEQFRLRNFLQNIQIDCAKLLTTSAHWRKFVHSGRFGPLVYRFNAYVQISYLRKQKQNWSEDVLTIVVARNRLRSYDSLCIFTSFLHIAERCTALGHCDRSRWFRPWISPRRSRVEQTLLLPTRKVAFGLSIAVSDFGPLNRSRSSLCTFCRWISLKWWQMGGGERYYILSAVGTVCRQIYLPSCNTLTEI